MWLIGSLAYGGFGPSSDVDIQVAVHGPTQREIAALTDRINRATLPCPAAGLEFVLYDLAAIRTPTPPLQWALNFNDGPDREYNVSTDPTSESWHWFLLDLAIGWQTAQTLLGEELRDVVGAVCRADQKAAIAESVRWHTSHENGSPNHVGNAARGLRFLRTGQWGSKPDALGWAASLGYSARDVIAELAMELDEGLQH